MKMVLNFGMLENSCENSDKSCLSFINKNIMKFNLQNYVKYAMILIYIFVTQKV